MSSTRATQKAIEKSIEQQDPKGAKKRKGFTPINTNVLTGSHTAPVIASNEHTVSFALTSTGMAAVAKSAPVIVSSEHKNEHTASLTAAGDNTQPLAYDDFNCYEDLGDFDDFGDFLQDDKQHKVQRTKAVTWAVSVVDKKEAKDFVNVERSESDVVPELNAMKSMITTFTKSVTVTNTMISQICSIVAGYAHNELPEGPLELKALRGMYEIGVALDPAQDNPKFLNRLDSLCKNAALSTDRCFREPLHADANETADQVRQTRQPKFLREKFSEFLKEIWWANEKALIKTDLAKVFATIAYELGMGVYMSFITVPSAKQVELTRIFMQTAAPLHESALRWLNRHPVAQPSIKPSK